MGTRKLGFILIVFILFLLIIKKLFNTKHLNPTSPEARVQNILSSFNHIFGTDEKLLFKTVSNLTKQELIDVFESFGIQRRLLGETTFNIFGKGLNLIHWFDAELTKRQLIRMYEIWKETKLFEEYSSRLFPESRT